MGPETGLRSKCPSGLPFCLIPGRRVLSDGVRSPPDLLPSAFSQKLSRKVAPRPRCLIPGKGSHGTPSCPAREAGGGCWVGHSLTPPDPARGLSEGRDSTGEALRVRRAQAAGKDFPETSMCLALCKVRTTVLPLGNSHVRAGTGKRVRGGPGSEYFRLRDGPCHTTQLCRPCAQVAMGKSFKTSVAVSQSNFTYGRIIFMYHKTFFSEVSPRPPSH